MADVTIDVNTSRQTFKGWEFTAQAGQWWKYTTPQGYQYPSTDFAGYKDDLLDLMIDCGFNRARVEISSGDETTSSWTSEDPNTFVNDNSNPNVINSSGFLFNRMTNTMDQLITPYRTKLQTELGEALEIVLCMVMNDFTDTTFLPANPDECAEAVFAFVDHFNSTYGYDVDAVEFFLEPDNTGGNWDVNEYSDALVEVRSRLDSEGYTGVKLYAFSNTNPNNVQSWYDDANTRNSSVATDIDEVIYHRYVGIADGNLESLRDNIDGNPLAMLEFIGADHGHLISDLLSGRVVAWQQYTLTYPYSDSS